MPLDRQLFRRTIAEALAHLLSQRFATSKQLARGIGCDPSTAENLRKGHLSVPTLEKALKAEGRDLWNKLGDEIFGEPNAEYEARRISAAITEAENVLSNLVRLQARREELLAGAGLVDPTSAGRLADEVGGAAGFARSRSAGSRDGQAEGQGHHAALEPRSFRDGGR